MKKIVFIIVGILVIAGVWQYFSANLVRSNIEEIFKSNGVEVVKSDVNGSLFNTQNSSIVRFKDLDFRIDSNTSHILGVTRTKGDIEVLSEPMASFMKVLFKDEKPIAFEMFGNDLSINIAELELDNDGQKMSIAKSVVNISENSDNSTKITLKSPLASFAEYNENLSLKGIEYELDTKNLADALEMLTSKSVLSVENIEYQAMFIPSVMAKNIKISSDAKHNENELNAKITGKAEQIKIAEIALNKIDFDVDISSIEPSSPTLLNEKSKINLNSLTFSGANNGKISANASFATPHYNSFANPLDNAQINGEINATTKVTEILGLDGFFASFEDELINDGVIKASKDGYSTQFKSDGNDIIFNGNVSLAKIIGNAFVKMLK